ncbi:Large subunit ribosomal protein L33 [Forsythia ovata]|uniref:Large subunit ribosomal protein L33 n=1 Tax=Forsythia ovata TaxID=205694 RepID=A0ABD1P3Y5_9LAMI
MEMEHIGAERTKNVLILMSDIGGGHRASAKAIRDAFQLEYGDKYKFVHKVRMGEKKKAGAMLVRLVSAAGTGFFYVVKKTKRLQSSQIKLEFRKYDPRVNRHVLFTEAKMK